MVAGTGDAGWAAGVAAQAMPAVTSTAKDAGTRKRLTEVIGGILGAIFD